MDADLDTLCTVVYCTADDLLPEKAANARRSVTDAEVVTLCVAQAIMGIPSGPAVSRCCGQTSGALVPAAAGAARVFQAPSTPHGDDRVAAGNFRQPQPGVSRRSVAHRLDAGRVCSQP